MNDSFSPQTVAVVALASLVTGFIAVFGGGMILLRQSPSARATTTATHPATPIEHANNSATPGASLVIDSGVSTDGSTPDVTIDTAATSATSTTSTTSDSGAPTAVTVSISPAAISRCWPAGAGAAATPGAQCGNLADLDRHFASRAAELSACTRAHGRMPFIIDLRFSTGSVRSWGGPSSSIANAGDVAVCVRRVTQPMPLAQMAHGFDRYILSVPLSW